MDGAVVGRIAQLVRAPALHAGCRGFESLFAHVGLFLFSVVKEVVLGISLAT